MPQVIKYSIILIIWALALSLGYAQTNKADSLISLLKTSTDPKIRVDLLNSLFLECEFSDPKKAKEFLIQALQIAKKTKLKTQEAEIYNNTGYYFEDIGQLDSALRYHTKALNLRISLNDKKAIGGSYNNIGVIHFNLGNYSLAIKNYKKSIRYKKLVKDEKGLGITYNAMGNLFTVQGNLAESIKYYLLFLKISENNRNQSNIASAYNNLGISYKNQLNYEEALNNFSKSLEISTKLNDKRAISRTLNNLAIVYFKQENNKKSLELHLDALKTDMEIGDKLNIANSLTNIANIYSEDAEIESNNKIKAKKFELSLENHFKSLKLRIEVGDKNGIANSNYNIGNTYLKQNKYTLAESYFSDANKLALKLRQKELIKNSYGALSELYSKIYRFKEAFQLNKLHVLYRDSLNNEESQKQIIQTQLTYDFEKKEAVAKAEHKKELENQQVIANQKSRKQRLVIGFVCGGLIIVFVFAVFILRSLRITKKQKKVIEDQKKVVENQKREVELQKAIVEEKQKEIMGSIQYAKRIQMALLPSEKLIGNALKRIKK
jgi:tetratricopeptide (TPR) repeat protein